MKETPGSAPNNCLSIFVKGLPFATTEEEFEEFFADCGEIVSARIVYNNTTGNSKGYHLHFIPDSGTLISRTQKQ